MKIYFTVALLISCNFFTVVFSQTTGGPVVSSDTNFIFTSPHPLITDASTEYTKKNISGFEILLSNFGVGFGVIYERIINRDCKFFSELFFTGVKNTDEFKSWDWDYYEYRVPNKIRRISAIPLNIGIKHNVGGSALGSSFRPFVGVMAVPTLIWEMPYGYDWFRDVKYSKSYFRVGGGVQVGADFGAINTSFISVRMRYTYTPFGDEGLESVIGSPIQNFGGFYISLAFAGFF